MNIPTHINLMWLQTLNGATGVIQSSIPVTDALDVLRVEQAKALRGDYGAGVVLFLGSGGDVLAEIAAEVQRAGELHAPLNSAHEAYSVILEEVDEFWDEVKKKQRDRDPIKMRAELIQIAAMAVRTIENLGL